ncbi:DUF1996 domain-containing protein [Streptomyces lavendulocolor]|uniref:DUF1996 domain-containing protein n=2 Tax=Streptomyces lavendulocolor TaxID=67316 RepID=A0ABV2W2Z5_9ACTN
MALMLGGGGLIAVNSVASAGESWLGGDAERTRSTGPTASTLDCPEVANGLPEVPEAARPEVDRELATLDSQITEAYQRFVNVKEQIAKDPEYARNAVLDPLKNQRAAGLDRIAEAIGRVAGKQPDGLGDMAACTLKVDSADDAGAGTGEQQDQGEGQDQAPDQAPDQGQGQGQGRGATGQAGNGPVAGDFADILSVQPDTRRPQQQSGASRGVFSTDCGVNESGKFNPDNVIVAPGVRNGAHHMHDYVGNQANDAFASDDDLAKGRTTCRNQGDKSTYYWPVLRVQNGQDENDAGADGGGKDKNVGEIRTPSEVTLNFVGSPVSKVTAMPRFLRIITGDAKAFVNGNANANASWSCTGFEDRQLKDKYPICPQGSKVVRSFKFQSCWDGQNTDSANHRTHVAFADGNGNCPEGFRAIPQLVQRIVYDVPPPVFDGDRSSVFALDSFPEQLHKPVTDHGDFINVFDDALMKDLVDCINEGRTCANGAAGDAPPPADGGQEAPGPGDGTDPGAGDPSPPAEPTEPPAEPTEPPSESTEPPSEPAEPTEPPAAGGEPSEPPAAPAEPPAAPAEPIEPPAAPAEPAEPAAPPAAGGEQPEAPPAAPAQGDRPTRTPEVPRPKAAASAYPGAAGDRDDATPAAPATPAAEDAQGQPQNAGTSPAGSPAGQEPTRSAGQEPPANEPVANGAGASQAAEGGLASTGAELWPSAAGALLLLGGAALMWMGRRREAAVVGGGSRRRR